MTFADIPLTPSIQRIVDLLTDAVWRGRRALVAAHGTPFEMRGSNTRAFADLSGALSTVRTLQRILRYVFIIMAAWIELPKARPLARPTLPTATSTTDRAHGIAAAAPRMCLSRPVRLHYAGERPQSACFVTAVRDPVRTLARNIDMLTHALLHPMPYVRRLARRLRRDTCFLAWRPPKHAPAPARQRYWQELLDARDQASWELRERRWLKRADSS